MTKIMVKQVPPDTPSATVPCGTCHQCCGKDTVAFLTEEEAERLETELYLGQPSTKKKPNGDCVYLERGVGCKIHDNPPDICRVYDCVGAYRLYRKRFGPEGVKKHMSKAIIRRARQLWKRGHRPDIDLADKVG